MFQVLKSIQSSIALINEHAEAKAFSKIKAEIALLYESLFKFQTLALELQEKQHMMKAEIIKCKDWKNKTVPNYILTEITDGVFVYVFKPVCESTEPKHYLCVNCFQKHRKSILQRTRRDGLGVHFHCPECGNSIVDHSQAETYIPPAVIGIKPERSRF